MASPRSVAPLNTLAFRVLPSTTPKPLEMASSAKPLPRAAAKPERTPGPLAPGERRTTDESMEGTVVWWV